MKAAMGRNHIIERTISDPRQRAASKRRKKLFAQLRANADKEFRAKLDLMMRGCHAPGCSNMAVGGEDGWWPCCSEQCFLSWTNSLEKTEDKSTAPPKDQP
jgi:hypothetical protein